MSVRGWNTKVAVATGVATMGPLLVAWSNNEPAAGGGGVPVLAFVEMGPGVAPAHLERIARFAAARLG